MVGKMTIFGRVIGLIVLLLTPVFILYSYSNKVSVDVVKSELQSSSLNQLIFFLRQFDATVEQLSMFPVILSFDPFIRDFVDRRSGGWYDVLRERTRIAEKLGLQSVSSAWMNELTLYLPQEQQVVSTNIFKSYRADDVARYAKLAGWNYEPLTAPDGGGYRQGAGTASGPAAGMAAAVRAQSAASGGASSGRQAAAGEKAAQAPEAGRSTGESASAATGDYAPASPSVSAGGPANAKLFQASSQAARQSAAGAPQIPSGMRNDAQFVLSIVEPPRATDTSQIKAMLQVAFTSANIAQMLDQVKLGGKGDPFFYQKGLPPITNSSPDLDKVQELLPLLERQTLEGVGHTVVELAGRQYAVNYAQSKQLGWFLVDYVPVENILAPITKTSVLFYTSIGLLLLASLLAAYMLYRHVQYPIRRLVHGVQLIKKGDFSARIEVKANNEFDFLFERFNDMAAQIQELVERVYEEKLRLREATLKQLQAQINPHFLYNSLFYVVNTAMLGDTEAVVAMAQNLAEYYRYTTRIDDQAAPLRDEIKLVQNYLTIQNLRMHRLHYEVDVPEAMLDTPIPRLLLQPVVENAIVHGIENKPGDGWIAIRGSVRDGVYELVVEDNGAGMSDQALQEFERRLSRPVEAEAGYGVWNVHQRLQIMFGEGAGLKLARSASGGVKATLRWTPRRQEGGDGDVPAIDRG
ncbi:sensor histidine kinase [Paenibacillus hamazuiensis]|uniref:sensor histidine kinase n=1 Tax=Paenibacillus hamazuiensis TaxID=2936508 RepID=UPI00200DD031|nr:sensor histidine kinase [Paenibacillus hamazuiensis]